MSKHKHHFNKSMLINIKKISIYIISKQLLNYKIKSPVTYHSYLNFC